MYTETNSEKILLIATPWVLLRKKKLRGRSLPRERN